MSSDFRQELLKLRSSAGTWTLAQDDALSKALDSFGTSMDKRMSDAVTGVETLGLELSRAQVQLSNAANELSALSRSQFMEHRVHEEDASLSDLDGTTGEQKAAAPPAPKSEEEMQAALLKDCRTMVEAGLNAMAAFPLIEADDAEESSALPGHSYVELALPFVIGTPEFNANDTCGLYEQEERETLRTTAATEAQDDGEDDDDDDDDEEEEEEGSEEESEEEDDDDSVREGQRMSLDLANGDDDDDDDDESEEEGDDDDERSSDESDATDGTLTVRLAVPALPPLRLSPCRGPCARARMRSYDWSIPPPAPVQHIPSHPHPTCSSPYWPTD